MHTLGTSPTHNPQEQGPAPISQTCRILDSKVKTSPRPFFPQPSVSPSRELGSLTSFGTKGRITSAQTGAS